MEVTVAELTGARAADRRVGDGLVARVTSVMLSRSPVGEVYVVELADRVGGTATRLFSDEVLTIGAGLAAESLYTFSGGQAYSAGNF